MHGSRWLALALLAAFAMGQTRPVAAQPAEPAEQQVKAALIFNITRFVEWPALTFSTPGAPLLIAIMGSDGVSEALEPMVQGKSVDGHPLQVRHMHASEDASKCQVLYIAASEKRRVAAILKTLGITSTLTVADIDHFAERGGHINLALVDQRVHIIVNLAGIQDSRLKMSAKLLSLADIVGVAR